MNLPMFDQNRKDEPSTYGESVRLSNELRAIKAHTVLKWEVNSFGQDEQKTYNIPDKWGFDCETAPYTDFTKWVNNKSIKKSQSLFWFVIRIMIWRFPEKHSEIRSALTERHYLEFDLIASQMKKEMEWIGLVGYQNNVRLDNSLTNTESKIVKLKNDQYRIDRK